jgi:hypothetical protein
MESGVRAEDILGWPVLVSNKESYLSFCVLFNLVLQRAEEPGNLV